MQNLYKMYLTKLTKLSISSRLFVMFLQFISNILIPDHNPDVFRYIPSETQETYFPAFLGGFIRWDAQYFMHIAKYGYTYENTLAFFPVYPFLVRILAEILNFFIPTVNLDTTLILLFILCNCILFILSAKTLYRLSLLLFDKSVALRAAVLFCFNPASIFFSAPYTECLFCFLTFHTVYYSLLLVHKYSNPNSTFSFSDATIIIFVALSTGVRSNGLLNIGFLIYPILCIFFTYFPKNNIARIRHILQYSCLLLVSCLICALPFVAFQIYCYQKFCTTYTTELDLDVLNFALKNSLVLPGQFEKFNQSWCYKHVPLAYSYVQDHYWNVGFLKYYELKQIPNFLLAAPCLYIVIKNCVLHFKLNLRNLVNIFNLNSLIVKKGKFAEKQFFKIHLTVLVLHALFLAIFCSLCIHVQVSTRMICSATPLFYWYCTYYYLNRNTNLIKLYFASYVIIGTVMFCNFLPWT